jgi:hypothetical protein
VNTIKAPKLTLERGGLRLTYDGWNDRVSGILPAEHSKRAEMRKYRFVCNWRSGQGEITEFEIVAKTENPNHGIKGTASENREDVKTVAKRTARLWREEKLKEQTELRTICQSDAAVPFIVSSSVLFGRKAQAWWIGQAVLLEPNQCGRHCKQGWIETLPIGNASQDVAVFVAQVFADNGNDVLCTEAARLGLSMAEIKRVLVAGEESWGEANTLMNQLSLARRDPYQVL